MAGDRSRLVGSCYPGDEPGLLQLDGKAGLIRHSPAIVLSLIPYFCRTFQKPNQAVLGQRDMAQTHITILVMRKIVAGVRARLAGSRYPEDEPGAPAARRESGLIRYSSKIVLSLNWLVNCFFRHAQHGRGGTNYGPERSVDPIERRARYHSRAWILPSANRFSWRALLYRALERLRI